MAGASCRLPRWRRKHLFRRRALRDPQMEESEWLYRSYTNDNHGLEGLTVPASECRPQESGLRVAGRPDAVCSEIMGIIMFHPQAQACDMQLTSNSICQ